MWRMCQVFLAILGVLMFQVFALVALEMNVYVVTEGADSNSTVPKLVKHMDELMVLNELKPKFIMKFGGVYDEGEFEFPGAY